MSTITFHPGDCRDILPSIPDKSVDAIITDPPYPGIDRDYGSWSVESWRAMMDEVIGESRRVLKPTGSMVVILQPNSERVGKMTSWLWRFLADWTDQWNCIQDVWWWNTASLPTVHTQKRYGLMRPSLKACIWLGPEDAYRDQTQVLWTPSDATVARAKSTRMTTDRLKTPSGHSTNEIKLSRAYLERGGVTPFNVLPMPNVVTSGIKSAHKHSAATPFALADWWCRYIVPQGGTILDPFFGSGTVGVAARLQGKSSIGIEINESYWDTIRSRISGDKILDDSPECNSLEDLFGL